MRFVRCNANQLWCLWNMLPLDDRLHHMKESEEKNSRILKFCSSKMQKYLQKFHIKIDPDFCYRTKILILTNFEIFDIFWDLILGCSNIKYFKLKKYFISSQSDVALWSSRPIRVKEQRGPIRCRVLKTKFLPLIWLAGESISIRKNIVLSWTA